MNGLGGDLGSLLREKTALLAELRELLAREQDALARGGHEAIVDLAEGKQRLALRLMELAHGLNERLGRAGFACDAEGLARCVQEQGDPALTALYDAVMLDLDECAVRNRMNGGLLERRRQAVDRALRVFFDRPEAGSRYQAGGRLEGTPASRLIGEA